MHNINKETIEALAADPVMGRLAAHVIIKEALALTVSNELNPLLRSVFERFDFRVGENGRDDGTEGSRITDPELIYLCEDEETLSEYFATCDVLFRQQGYELRPGESPILVANHLQLEAEQNLVEYASGKLGIQFQGRSIAYGKFFKLMMNITANNPARKRILDVVQQHYDALAA